MKLLAVFTAVAAQLFTADANDIGDQSQYTYETLSTDTPQFDWNITITSFMSIDKPTTEQGIYNLRSSYLLDDRSYDVELFKDDCKTAPTGIDDSFPLIWNDGSNAPSGTINEVEFQWTYNQTEIENSDLWTANKTGGDVYFCIRVNNYLPTEVTGSDPFFREMNFLEVRYHIEVDSLTDFNATIDIERLAALESEENFINYEEDIQVYQCENFIEITSPPELTQGDYLQLCVETVDGSKFGVHSIKELDVSQNSTNIYPYIDGFIASPLAETDCIESNTTGAICRAKMQLLSAYFDNDDPHDLFAEGTVKLDYVGRRLSVDVPVNLKYNHASVEGDRMLAEEGDASFGLEVSLSGDEKESSGIKSAATVLTAGAAMLAAGLV